MHVTLNHPGTRFGWVLLLLLGAAGGAGAQITAQGGPVPGAAELGDTPAAGVAEELLSMVRAGDEARTRELATATLPEHKAQLERTVRELEGRE